MYLGVPVGGTVHACSWEFSHLHGIQLKTEALTSVLPNQGLEVARTKKAVHLSHPKLQHQKPDLIRNPIFFFRAHMEKITFEKNA